MVMNIKMDNMETNMIVNANEPKHSYLFLRVLALYIFFSYATVFMRQNRYYVLHIRNIIFSFFEKLKESKTLVSRRINNLKHIDFKKVYNALVHNLDKCGIEKEELTFDTLKCLNMVNLLEITSQLMENISDLSDNLTCDVTETCNGEEEQKTVTNKQTKYEDKYLDEIRQMSKEIVLTEKEYAYYETYNNSLYETELKHLIENKINLEKAIQKLNDELQMLDNVEEFDNVEDEHYDTLNNGNCRHNDNIDDSDDSDDNNPTIEESRQEFIDEICRLNEDLEKLNKTVVVPDEVSKLALKHVIDERNKKYINNYVIEKTPIGNVAMTYNNSRGTFDYYSDNTIPYRFLEVVSRKFVKTYNCRHIYVDMEEELKECERKLEELEKLEQQNKENDRVEKTESEELNTLSKLTSNVNNINPTNTIQKNKTDVFAKFKSYNKDNSLGHGGVPVAPPKNSIPVSHVKTKAELQNEKILLKENANRYICEGRFSNFNPLKKVQKKDVSKRYGMTFSEFKKMKITTK